MREPSLSIKVFLSHRYKSPDVNLYFFKLFSEMAEVQFEVDEGTFSTNVTRLERMVRGTDGFIGIYPFPGSWEEARSSAELLKASRYFRLELDLAVRSRRPAVVFYDERYGDLLRPPAGISCRSFEALEVVSSGGFTHADWHRKVFKEFIDVVKARRAYDLAKQQRERSVVGVFVPESAKDGGYKQHQIKAIEDTLSQYGGAEIRRLPWPPVLNRRTFDFFGELDYACVDVCDEMAKTGIPSYLHGQFVPTIRLKKVNCAASKAPKTTLEQFLYGGVEVGYNKDIVVWRDVTSLTKGLRQRLASLKAGVTRINTSEEARDYFERAALRKEAVFLSYSGKDQVVAAKISAELKNKYHKVFDYRDGKSIEAGQPWLEEIFGQLATSAIGIQLLSKTYLESKNCMHEAQDMVALRDSGSMHLIPLRLTDDTLDIPHWLKNLQHMRLSLFKDDPVKAVQEIVNLTGKKNKPAATRPQSKT